MGKKVKWQLENGILTVDTQGTLYKFLPEEEKSKIQKVIIEKSCSRIGVGVFAGCTNLLEVILPESLRIIAENAFRDCHQLKNIVFPERLIEIWLKKKRAEAAAISKIPHPAEFANYYDL